MSQSLNQVHIHNVYVIGAIVPNQIPSKESLSPDVGSSKVDEFIGEPYREAPAPVLLYTGRVSQISVKRQVG